MSFFNVGKGPQTNLPISVTAPNTHQWKESSPSFLSPTSTSQSFFHPPSSTALGDDDICNRLVLILMYVCHDDVIDMM